MTFTQLVTNIGEWINRTHGELDAMIANQIIESQYQLEMIGPLWFLMDEYTGIITINSESIKLPNYTIQCKHTEIQDSQGVKYPFTFKSIGEVRDRYPMSGATSPETGRPEVGAMMGHVVEFGPKADVQYTFITRLWHHLDPLDAVINHSNEWTTTYLSTLRYHILCALSGYIKDNPQVEMWERRLNECVNNILAEVTRNEHPNLQEVSCDVEDIY